MGTDLSILMQIRFKAVFWPKTQKYYVAYGVSTECLAPALKTRPNDYDIFNYYCIIQFSTVFLLLFFIILFENSWTAARKTHLISVYNTFFPTDWALDFVTLPSEKDTNKAKQSFD